MSSVVSIQLNKRLFTHTQTPKQKVAELDARAEGLRDEVARATQDGAALREDASAAASRASEARGALAEAEKEAARLTSRVETLRATRAALDSELGGLRHELDALRRRGNTSSWGAGWTKGEGSGLVQAGPLLVEGGGGRGGGGDGDGGGGGGGGRYGTEKGTPSPSVGRATRRGKVRACRGEDDDDSDGGGGDGGLVFGEGTEVRAWKGASRFTRRRGPGENDLDLDGDIGSGGQGGNLVEIVAEFQGRLRRQVQAALADGGVSSSHDVAGNPSEQRSSSFSRLSVGPVRVRQAREDQVLGGVFSEGRRKRDGAFAGRAGGGCDDVIGELEQRIGSV